MRFLFVLLLLAPLALHAVDSMETAADQDPEETERLYMSGLEKRAADFRAKRAVTTATPGMEAKAVRDLRLANAELAKGEWRRAWKIAGKAFKKYPYASVAPHLKHVVVEARSKKGHVPDARQALIELWLYFPDYSEIGAAMETALAAAEKAQAFTSTINLEADDPGDVIDLEGTSYLEENNRLFRFLSLRGDRETVAPRAALGLARALMLSTSRKEFSEVHAAYERFLDDYPNNELTFTAQCELALSYLVTYKGNHFDIGALLHASSVIDQAEIDTRGDPKRSELVQAYRRRIRAWLQERDLAVARWYRNRKRPAFLAWLKEPSFATWEEGARHYYNEVIKRDATSKHGRLAAEEEARLPAPRYDILGENLLDKPDAKPLKQ